jgi:hypothetical protein
MIDNKNNKKIGHDICDGIIKRYDNKLSDAIRCDRSNAEGLVLDPRNIHGRNVRRDKDNTFN